MANCQDSPTWTEATFLLLLQQSPLLRATLLRLLKDKGLLQPQRLATGRSVAVLAPRLPQSTSVIS